MTRRIDDQDHLPLILFHLQHLSTAAGEVGLELVEPFASYRGGEVFVSEFIPDPALRLSLRLGLLFGRGGGGHDGIRRGCGRKEGSAVSGEDAWGGDVTKDVETSSR